VSNNIGVGGISAVGVIVELPEFEKDFSLNDSVFVVGSGLWTDEVVVTKSSVTKIPTTFPLEHAALLPSLSSAWNLLNNFKTLKAGDNVLVTETKNATGSAIAEIAKVLGLNVITVSKKDLDDPSYIKHTRSMLNSKLIITSCGASAHKLSKLLAPQGSLVIYNGIIDPSEYFPTVDIPVSSAIFNDISVHGFDFKVWHDTNKSAFEEAVGSVVKLYNDNKILAEPNVYQQKDFLKAIHVVESGDSAVVIKL
jgi:NADPH:quinone reductase-like Zn-dependent oxidoreductase